MNNRFMILDDDSDSVRQIKRVVLERIPNARIVCCDNLLDAVNHPSKVDVLIVDVSSLVPVMLWHAAWSPICSWIERHPGADIIINSACSGLDAIVEDVKERSLDARVTATDWAGADLETLLDQYVASPPGGE